MKKIFFGLSVNSIDDLPGLAAGAAGHFSMLKMPYQVFESSAWQEIYRKKFKNCSLYISDAADRTLCRMVPELSLKLQTDFISRFAGCCRRVSEQGACCISGGFDFDRMLADSDFRRKSLSLLLSLSRILQENRLRLLLNIRLPRLNGDSGCGAAARMMYSLPDAVFGLAAELHPHEPQYARMMPDILAPVRFDIDMMDAVYEPGTGNRLTPADFASHIACLGEFERPVRIFFSPAGLEADSFASEAAALVQLCRDLTAR